jgi:hypothetical protein
MALRQVALRIGLPGAASYTLPETRSAAINAPVSKGAGQEQTFIEGPLSADSVEKVGHGLRIKKVRVRD